MPPDSLGINSMQPTSISVLDVVEVEVNSGRNPSALWSKVFVICQPLQSCECIPDKSTKIHLGSFEGESHFGSSYYE